MPITRGKDVNGPYYQWGSQKKYYYKAGDRESRYAAYDLARKQAVAIYASGWRDH
jgi:hypothetical protein